SDPIFATRSLGSLVPTGAETVRALTTMSVVVDEAIGAMPPALGVRAPTDFGASVRGAASAIAGRAPPKVRTAVRAAARGTAYQRRERVVRVLLVARPVARMFVQLPLGEWAGECLPSAHTGMCGQTASTSFGFVGGGFAVSGLRSSPPRR